VSDVREEKTEDETKPPYFVPKCSRSDCTHVYPCKRSTSRLSSFSRFSVLAIDGPASQYCHSCPFDSTHAGRFALALAPFRPVSHSVVSKKKKKKKPTDRPVLGFAGPDAPWFCQAFCRLGFSKSPQTRNLQSSLPRFYAVALRDVPTFENRELDQLKVQQAPANRLLSHRTCGSGWSLDFPFFSRVAYLPLSKT
jgi:hypothetical protein